MEQSKGRPMMLARNSSSSSSFRLRSPSLNSLRLRRTFDLFDKNGDGFITINELNQALGILGLDTDLSELNSMVESYIKPGNAGLLYDDFQTFHRALDDTFFGGGVVEEMRETTESSDDEEENNADLMEAFKVFDVDGDGFISAQELQTVLEKLGFEEGKEMKRVEEMIVSVDRNQDGVVDFLEFKDMMRNVTVPFPLS
uniref:EF-hand domain-containing protein n=1 Tax=Kalanchoe fedtschenkoi TaxID=63787 RepID=A0A7N0T332_KALFE